MKRIFLTILAVMALLPVAAQTDTTQHRIDTVTFPLNVPTYFQNDWINGRDRYEFTSYEHYNSFPAINARRYDIPGDSLKLVGLAGVFGIERPDDPTRSMPVVDTTTDPRNREKEYLLLYECRPDTIRMIKRMTWKYVNPRCRLDIWVWWGETMLHRIPSLYEVYFDEPITVYDSFYVGGTMENCGIIIPDVGEQYLGTLHFDALPRNKTDSITMRGIIPHMIAPNWDTTRWFFSKTLHEYMFFPIIDTTGMTPPDTTQGGDTTVVDTTVLDTTGISRLADQFTRILPNPTTGHAVVHSSIPMRSVAVYDPAGRCILRRRVDGTIAQLDLEGHARGQYYVVIETPAGRALKRLLLQ